MQRGPVRALGKAAVHLWRQGTGLGEESPASISGSLDWEGQDISDAQSSVMVLESPQQIYQHRQARWVPRQRWRAGLPSHRIAAHLADLDAAPYTACHCGDGMVRSDCILDSCSIQPAAHVLAAAAVSLGTKHYSFVQ